jgi:hypothetical protein
MKAKGVKIDGLEGAIHKMMKRKGEESAESAPRRAPGDGKNLRKA